MKQNKSAIEFNAQTVDQLQKICTPLFSNTCINSFRYFKIFEGGRYFMIGTNHDWLCERMLKIHNNGTHFQKAVRAAIRDKITYCVWEHTIKDPILDLFLKYNTAYGITLFRRCPKSVEGWSFGTNAQNTSAINFYINNLQLIETFIDYFTQAGSQLIDTSYAGKLAHFDEAVTIKPMGPSFSPTPQNRGLEQALKSVLVEDQKMPLSPRETEALALLSIGKSSKEIANILHISSRTVESYIATIKHKLDFRSKGKLVDYFWKHCSHKIGLIISLLDLAKSTRAQR